MNVRSLLQRPSIIKAGQLGGLVTRLDYGDPARPKENLFQLFRSRFEVIEGWSYDNRFRTFHIFGFELKPLST